jgi:hypothetical protein
LFACVGVIGLFRSSNILPARSAGDDSRTFDLSIRRFLTKLLHGFKQIQVEDRLMLALVHLVAINDLADIEAVLQKMGERADPIAGRLERSTVRQWSWLWLQAFRVQRSRQRADRAETQIFPKDLPNAVGLIPRDLQLLADAAIAEGNGPPTQIPFRLEAAILSRTRSPITSRSNWAKDSNTLSVSRPMLDVVLNDWVTDTKDASCWPTVPPALSREPFLLVSTYPFAG